MWLSSVLGRSTTTSKPTPRGRPARVRPRKFVPALEALEGRDTPSTTVLTVSPNPATVGQTVTLTATVTRTGSDLLQPGTGKFDRGQVTFFERSAPLGTVDVTPTAGSTTQGTAKFSFAALEVCTHSLSARYSGDVNFLVDPEGSTAQSTSNAVAGVVTPVPPPPPQIVAVAFRRNGVSQVRVLDAASGAVRGVLTPFRGFGGRLHLQRRDVNGDGSLDLIVQAVIHAKRKKKVFDAVTLGPLPAGLA